MLTTIQDGGMETLVYRIYKGLDPEKYDFHVCSLTRLEENFLVNNYKEINTSIKEFDFVNKSPGLSGHFKNLMSMFKLARYISKNKFDVVNAHDFFSGSVVRFSVVFFTVWYKPKRLYVTLHNLFYWLKPIHHKVNNFLSRFTSKIICVSGSVKDYSSQNDKIISSKYEVIYNGIDVNYFYKDEALGKSVRNELGFNDIDIIIGNVGTFSERKGQIYLIKAFTELAKKYSELKIVFLGGLRNHEVDVRKEVEKEISINNLKEKVFLLDSDKDVNKYYNMFDIYVMSSITEGFSLAALEAMLTERLCVFSDIPPFKELVEDGKNGFLFESKNPDSLKTKLDFIIANRNKLNHISSEARRSVINRFSYENMIHQYDSLYNVNLKK